MAKITYRYLLSCVCLLLGADVAIHQAGTPPYLPMNASLIPLNSPKGRQLLAESQAQEAFWSLTQFYSPQPDLGSCSIASSVMVLNALPIDRPVSRQHAPFKLFTADNFFNSSVEAIVAKKTVSESGMTLDQLTKTLNTFPIKVERFRASESSAISFRKELADALSHANAYVLVNYLRSALGQNCGGHFSPVGAFNAKGDMVLILDTANYKYPWTWVTTDHLWSAMVDIDPASERTRGFVVISTR